MCSPPAIGLVIGDDNDNDDDDDDDGDDDDDDDDGFNASLGWVRPRARPNLGYPR